MGDRIDLPSGGWVEFIDPSGIRGKQRKEVMSQPGMTGLNRDSSPMLAGYAVTAGIAHVCVERYSVPYAPFDGAVRINMTEEDWDELEIADQNAIDKGMAAHQLVIFPEAASVDNMKPGSPTLPAGA